MTVFDVFIMKGGNGLDKVLNDNRRGERRGYQNQASANKGGGVWYES